MKLTLINKNNFLNHKIILLIILSAVFVLHIPGLFYSFPLKNTVGDEVTTMGVIFKMMSDYSLRPNYASFYHLPVTAYAQLPFYALLTLFLKFSGLFSGWEDVENFVVLDYGYFLPFARFLTSLFALGAVYMIYALSVKIFKSKKAGLLAGFLLSFNLMFFQVSHFARAWSLQILLLLITVYVYYDFFERQKNKTWDYFVISFFTALSFGVHLASSLIYVIFLAFYFYKNSLIDFIKFNGSWRTKHKNFVYLHIFIVLWLLFFYYLNPAGFLIYLQQPGIENTAGIGNLFANLWFYVKVFFSYDFLIALLSIPAFILLYYRNKQIFFAFVGFIFIFIAVIGYAVHSEPRFIIAAMPFFIIPVSYFIVWLVNKIKISWRRGLVYISIIVFVAYLPLLWTAQIIKPNTLLLARQWILQNIPPNSVILSSNPYLDIPENKESALFTISLNSKADTIERRFIINARQDLLAQPRYFVLTAQGLGGIHSDFGDTLKKVEYIVISFWTRAQQEQFVSNISNFDMELAQKYYPSETLADLTDIANNMLKPYSILNNINQTGPFVEIYKVNN